MLHLFCFRLSAQEASDYEKMKGMCNSRARPFVVRGYAKEWDCVKTWGGDRLVELAAEEARSAPHRKYRVAEVPDDGLLMLTEGRHRIFFNLFSEHNKSPFTLFYFFKLI